MDLHDLARVLKYPSQRCRSIAKQSNRQCRRQAIPGGTVCVMHGGLAPQTVNAARHRLMMMLDPAVVELYKVMVGNDVAPADKLKAISMIFDRALGPVAKDDPNKGDGSGTTVQIVISPTESDALDAKRKQRIIEYQERRRVTPASTSELPGETT